ncbi:hypothetical protein, partial [Streptomyces sp. NPDC059122]|uniref:hypothetical protein n=1 Tax=Streptomyces sp. NPDC059122 TaxID=3346732 RepID=UPI003673DD41
ILSALIFAGAIRPFGFLAVPTLPDPFPSLAPCWSGVRPLRFRFSAFPTLSDLLSVPDRQAAGSNSVLNYPSEGACLSTFPTLSEAIRPK